MSKQEAFIGVKGGPLQVLDYSQNRLTRLAEAY